MKTQQLPFISFLIVLAALLVVYLPTLQTIPNGSDHFLMVDVGETQIVLNVWGTLHATGYPLYVILGNILVTVLKLFGVSAVIAPVVVSVIWGIVALALIYTLALHLTGRVFVSALAIGVFGMTRMVWMHHVIAEIYTFGLAIHALLLLIALWHKPIPHRIYWLALIGGIGVSHHRAMLFVAPALLYAVLPELNAQRKRLPRILIISLLLGLVGLLPYVFLPLREWAGGIWVYGEPGTLQGLWDQFIGREAEQFIGVPETSAGIWANFVKINGAIIDEVTLPGLIIGVVGLLAGLWRYRRAAITLILAALVSYGFHVLAYTDILVALILPVTLSLAFGWLFVLDFVWSIRTGLVGATHVSPLQVGAGAGMLALAWLMYGQNEPYISALTQDTIGHETIALLETAPEGSTVMLDWGPRYFASGFAHDVSGDLEHIQVVHHNGDFERIVREGMLITPDYTFFRRPVSWWEAQIGAPVYLRAVAPNLVQIDTDIERATITGADNIQQTPSVSCTDESIILAVEWAARDVPQADLSIFVHLLDNAGNVIAQADQFAPVYGWRPMTTWQAGELVRDIYPLPRRDDADMIRYGLYRQLADGSFENEYEYSIPSSCD